MKTLQELVKDANDLQKLITKHSADLHEYTTIIGKQTSTVDIDKLMMMATHYKIKYHILHENISEYVINAYLELLLSVAQSNTPVNKDENHPALYVCRIAAALPQIPNMKELLQNSMLLDEKKISEYVLMIKSHELENMFILDALLMASMYDIGNEGKIEFIADLASLFAIEKENLKEIIAVAKEIIQLNHTIKINTKYLQTKSIYPYLRNMKAESISVNSPDIYVRWYSTPTNFIDELPLNLEDKNLIYIYNAVIDGLKYHIGYGERQAENLPLPHPFTLRKINNIHLDKCFFSNILLDSNWRASNDDRKFVFKLIDVCNFVIEQCEFDSIYAEDGNGGGNINRYHGLICNCKNVLKSKFILSVFKNCYYLSYDSKRGYNLILGDRLVYGDNDSIKHIIDEECIYENSCTLPR